MSRRLRLRRALRAAYRRVHESPVGPVLDAAPVDRLRRRLISMSPHDVHEVVGHLRGAGMEVWIGGGWGVDALLGGRPRRHEDMDLVIRREDEGRVLGALMALGFRPLIHFQLASELMPRTLRMRDPAGRTVELHPGAFPFAPSARLPPELDELTSLPSEEEALGWGALDGRDLPCLSPIGQLVSRTGYEARPIDLHDIARLVERYGLPAPRTTA